MTDLNSFARLLWNVITLQVISLLAFLSLHDKMSNIAHICFFQLTWDKFIISHIIIFSFSSHETSLLFLILLFFLSAHMRQVYYFSSFSSHETSLLFLFFFFHLTWDKFIISHIIIFLSAHMRQVNYFPLGSCHKPCLCDTSKGYYAKFESPDHCNCLVFQGNCPQWQVLSIYGRCVSPR
jgi:hypothetical protein